MEKNKVRPRKRKGKSKRNKRRVRWSVVLPLLILFVIGVGVWQFMFPTSGRNATIAIPRGATASMVEDSISRQLGDAYAARVMRSAAVMGFDLTSRPGLYEIKSGVAPWRAAWHLARGGQKTVTLVLNNLRTREDILNFISSKMACGAGQIDSILSSPERMKEYDLTAENADALFLNNSFEFYWNAGAEEIISKIGKYYLSFWNETRREKSRYLGLTPGEVVVLASIVEEESNVKSEHGRIGRLYLNRLKKGMRLQADPTVKFAIGDFTIKRVTSEMLNTESPYNTYRNAGLPPGPIRTVEPGTIDAILDSAPSEDLYMCAKSDFSGGHDFTSSYTEHLKNAARYREALNNKGIH